MKHEPTKFDGMDAKVIDEKHPHYGSIATCLGADLTAIGYAMKFKRKDTNEEFYVFLGRQIKWID